LQCVGKEADIRCGRIFEPILILDRKNEHRGGSASNVILVRGNLGMDKENGQYDGQMIVELVFLNAINIAASNPSLPPHKLIDFLGK
jgi:hypothetical protein